MISGIQNHILRKKISKDPVSEVHEFLNQGYPIEMVYYMEIPSVHTLLLI